LLKNITNLFILQVIIGRKTTADRAGEGRYFWILKIKLKRKLINVPDLKNFNLSEYLTND